MGAIEAYKSNSITTQSKGGLIVLLYDGAIKALKQAIAAIEDGNFAAKGKYIGNVFLDKSRLTGDCAAVDGRRTTKHLWAHAKSFDKMMNPESRK